MSRDYFIVDYTDKIIYNLYPPRELPFYLWALNNHEVMLIDDFLPSWNELYENLIVNEAFLDQHFLNPNDYDKYQVKEKYKDQIKKYIDIYDYKISLGYGDEIIFEDCQFSYFYYKHKYVKLKVSSVPIVKPKILDYLNINMERIEE